MIHEKYTDLITGHLQGTLNAEDQQNFQNLIDEGTIKAQDINEMEMLYEQLEDIETPEPGENMKSRFYTMLESEINKQQKSFSSLLKSWIIRLQNSFEFRRMVFTTAVFCIGLLIGYSYTSLSTQDEQIERLTDEVSQMREMMMISLLNNSSPTERLRAVNISTEIHSADNRVVEALLKTLNSDPNVNVRIAAVDALIRHAANPEVRRGMVRSITAQDSPVVQVALADAMLVLQEKQSVEEFRKLLEKNGLDSNVRSKLENTIVALI
ncbi:MAG: HEAT repeat domain-containing protein [Balneolaceae bacterium]